MPTKTLAACFAANCRQDLFGVSSRSPPIFLRRRNSKSNESPGIGASECQVIESSSSSKRRLGMRSPSAWVVRRGWLSLFAPFATTAGSSRNDSSGISSALSASNETASSGMLSFLFFTILLWRTTADTYATYMTRREMDSYTYIFPRAVIPRIAAVTTQYASTSRRKAPLSTRALGREPNITEPRTTVLMKTDAPSKAPSVTSKSSSLSIPATAPKTSGAPLPKANRVTPATSGDSRSLRERRSRGGTK
mmetsp:Transcript_6967/g.25657  ORF Transcript_6967/g.25657 Transcript_6967/m.25657 type:complete len:250 (-) Transcript_6967:406-1155(-)